jgi:hypothetical protein
MDEVVMNGGRTPVSCASAPEVVTARIKASRLRIARS